MTTPSEPFYGQNARQQMLSPVPSRRWTPPFLFLLALCVLVEMGTTFLVLFGDSDNATAYPLSLYQAGMAIAVMFLVVDVVALCLVRDALLRTAFILNIIVRAGTILILLPSFLAALNISTPPLVISYPFQFFQPGLAAAGLAGQICLSYGLVRWHPSDKIWVWVQLLLMLGVGYALLQGMYPSPTSYVPFLFLSTLISPFFATAGVICLLGRPACWKTQPLIVFCLTFGTAVSLLFGYVITPLLSSSFAQPNSSTTSFVFSQPNNLSLLYEQLYAVLNGVSGILLVVGILLLIQQQRRPAQAIAPW